MLLIACARTIEEFLIDYRLHLDPEVYLKIYIVFSLHLQLDKSNQNVFEENYKKSFKILFFGGKPQKFNTYVKNLFQF